MSDNKNIWFTSDLHFGHDNIVKYCDRPCTVAEHTDFIIESLNRHIKDDDTVYHLGDFSYGKKIKFDDLKAILDRLKGNWQFIIGNHDNENQLKALCQKTKHKVLGDYHSESIEGKTFIMFHYPIESWWNKKRGAIHLYGHTHHNDMRHIENRYNVCFDRDFKPYSLSHFVA
ncbi:MAG: metallophosphoesterase family protein [Psychrobacter sp.]